MKSRVSLRFTMTLLNAAVVAVVLASVAGLLYTSLRRTMLRLVDVSLQEALLAAVEEVAYDKGIPIFDDEQGLDPDEVVTYRVSPFEGRVVAAWITSIEGGILDTKDDWDGPLWSSEREGAHVERTADGTPWRVYSRPLLDDRDAHVGWIHTAQPLNFIQDTLRRMTRIMVAGLSAILLFSVAAGWLLMGRALRPLTDIAATTAAIDGINWQHRIGYHGPIAEIAELSGSFDRMLERLEGVFERERRFTADAAHELRTPLTVLKGHIDVALGRGRSLEEYRKTLKVLRSYVDRLVNLAVDLLIMARLEQDSSKARHGPIELDNLIGAVVDQMEPTIGSRELTIHGSGREVIINGDMDHLIRLFMNLLDNAVKYSPDDGRIEVCVTAENGNARVTVSNTGPGIPKAELPKVFDRFYRVRNDRSRNTGGSGLGLAIARKIAWNHGGTIRVESEPGVRTVFTVELPCALRQNDVKKL